MPRAPTHILEVWGDFACISRPELKVERWSYPCPTPSAARGVFDAIYCHPKEFRWQVTKIELLSLPQYIALRRNEVKEKVNVNAVKQWLAGKADVQPIRADADKALTGSDEKGRTQRQTMALRDVRYRLHAHVVPWPGFEGRRKAFDQQFIRRASRGKCWMQPYLGCREFVAFFRLVTDLASEPPAAAHDQDVGLMLYDVFDLSRPNDCYAKPFISLFEARIRAGVLEVPPFDSDDVLKPDGGERRAG